MADEAEEGEGLVTEDEDEEEDGAIRRPRRKKGNWKNIGHTPRNLATYPCECRWKLRFPKGPCVKYKQVRWVVMPLSDRLKQLALPLLRRLLALWMEFGDKLPPEMKARLMGFLIENYGLTAEFLEQILEEARKAREEAEQGKKEEKKKGKKGKGKKKGRGKKKGKKEKDGTEGKKGKGKDGDGGLGFKRRKPGKLPFDWPYKTGSKFILSCISYLSQDPDEDFNSRATEYFDVQSMAILEQVCKFLNMALPDPDRPTQYGETLVIMALNLSDWIAKYVTAPAQEIPDELVDEYLALRGVKPKPPKKGKKDKNDSKIDRKDKKKKDSFITPESEEPEEVRVWGEMKSPVYVPPKTRVSKRKRRSRDDEEEGGFATETEMGTVNEDESEGVPRWNERTLNDLKQDFLDYLNWYNPWAPEFMYLGPKKIPEGVEMFKIWDEDSDDVPEDLRVLNWKIVEHGYKEGYSFVPAPVPQYYPCLRPLRPIRLEELERSGLPKEVVNQSLRFSSPWYIMSQPLKEPVPEPEPEPEVETEPEPPAEPIPQTQAPEEGTRAEPGEGGEGGEDAILQDGTIVGIRPETEEEFEDEILQPSAPPKVKDSVWGDFKMKEQIEILAHILHLTSSVPDLTIEYVFELLEDFCEAVECAESEENPSEENKMLLKKRTVILERYYLDFFGKKFRDYNERTPHYMRVICSRFAYYIQLLYEYTARNLWELQSRANKPDLFLTPVETPDDEQALQDWDDWLAWLLRVTRTCDEWAGWISETVDEAERKAAKKKGEFIGPDGNVEWLTEEEWYSWKEEVEDRVHGYRHAKRIFTSESPYYLEKSRYLKAVKHRPVKKYGAELEEEGGEWEDISEEGEEDEGLGRGEAGEDFDQTDGTTAGDTEYEDVTEND